ncbi:MAG: glycosyltransferase family A protein [Actinomycetota bacterium]|nr:glycosyltransferase family A protein [Actinomycetota bacterium]
MSNPETTPRIVIARPAGAGERTLRMLDAARHALWAEPAEIVDYPVLELGLPAGTPAGAMASFAATPGALIESWRVARHLEAATRPGDIVVVPDRWGFGGVFAVEQAVLPIGLRRRVWTVAGEGIGLESMVTAGTTDGLEGEMASALDWEIAQYRESERIIVLAAAVSRWMAPYAADVRLEVEPDLSTPPQLMPGEVVVLPESVSRRSQTQRVLRALSGVLGERHNVSLVVSPVEEEDQIWTGSSWDVVAPLMQPFVGRVKRGGLPAGGRSIVVLGDVIAVPDQAVIDARKAGVHVVVPHDSAAASLWPDAPTWRDEDDLAHVVGALLDGDPTDGEPRSDAHPVFRSRRPLAVDTRAQHVSVGVPVYRNIDFLGECVESILAQTQPPHEVLLIDDGSGSDAVDAALARWVEREPALVRTLRQPNRGVCTARNHMIAEMSGDAFFLIDADDVMAPSTIQRTADALRRDDSLWAVAVWTEFFGEYEGVEAKPPFDRRVALRENPIVSTAALVDMRVRDEGIAFAPDLAFLYCEDWHYWSQIVAAGGRMGLVPEPLIRHRVHHASGGFQRTELAHRIGKARAIEPLLRG